MTIELHRNFKKSYQKRITGNKSVEKKALERVKLFKVNPKNPLLKDHALKGKKYHMCTFSVTGDIRIVYIPVSENHVVFIDIGTHNQVY